MGILEKKESHRSTCVIKPERDEQKFAIFTVYLKFQTNSTDKMTASAVNTCKRLVLLQKQNEGFRNWTMVGTQTWTIFKHIIDTFKYL